MGGRKKDVTVGYRYYLGAHLVLCHGPVDEVREIIVGSRTAWSGSVTASGRISVNVPELFGGESREGGIAGAVDVLFGEPAQTPNDYLAARQGSPQPAYRGVLSLVLRQIFIAANNPYLKPWWVRVKRCYRGWYPAKAEIGGAANPAHILYECLTNAAWGMGYPGSTINEASFQAAADQLYAEGFGLNLLWAEQASIENFVTLVLDHIGAALTTSASTGKWQLKLIRADYDPATLPVFGPDEIVALESYQRAAWGETVNEVVVVYTRPDTWQETSVAVQDLANLQAQGAVVSQTRRYPGITSDSLAAQVALRDLAALSTPLAKARFKVNRRAWSLVPGDVFALAWPALGIERLIMRVAAIDSGTLQDGAITIEAVEDVFGLPAAAYVAPQPSGWGDPLPAPAVPPYRRLIEAPYWDLARTLSAADLAYLDATDGYLQGLAVRPAPGAIDYDFYAKSASGSAFAFRGKGAFCPSATLVQAIGPAVTSTVGFTDEVDMDLVAPGSYGYLDDEVVEIAAIDLVSRVVTLNRGMLDTVPAAHAALARLWVAEGFQAVDETEYADGETVQARMLTVTGRGVLAMASAPTDALVMRRRQNRPYPPGNVLVAGQRWPQVIVGELALTWAHRNRLQQTASLIKQDAGSIGPEAGTTYTLRIYNAADILKHTESGLTGTAYTYPVATEIAECGALQPRLRVELEATRGGLSSLQKHSMAVDRAGWGLRWGEYWGGAPVGSYAGLPTSYGYGDSFVGNDPYFANVVLLLHMDGAEGSTVFTDVKNHTITANGNAKISTAQSRFGAASGAFDGSGDWLSSGYVADWDLLPGPFTIEGWVYITANRDNRIFATGGGAAAWNATNGIHVLVQRRSGQLDLQLASGGSSPIVALGGSLPLNTWVHIAVSVGGGTARGFINGVQVLSFSTTGVNRPSGNPSLGIGKIPGETNPGSWDFGGYMDELRVTKGIARYTADFTPPTAPFPDS